MMVVSQKYHLKSVGGTGCRALVGGVVNSKDPSGCCGRGVVVLCFFGRKTNRRPPFWGGFHPHIFSLVGSSVPSLG